jgi:tetratricopeptide (TPR) repeat protein
MVTSRPADVVLPESVQGIIAARLDTLSADEKELLQKAAVLGRVFWLGALGRERWTLEAGLHSLARKEFVTPNRRSTVAGEDEYVFRHALVRDVAYEQIPRAQRVEMHVDAAEWMESLGRPEDHAEMLAHHYASAIVYARAAGRSVDAIADRARVALRDAGDRALALTALDAAVRYYELAVELCATDDPERPGLLLKLARARHIGGDEERERSLEEAREALLGAGRVEQAAEADALLAEVWWHRGVRDRCDRHLERAYAAVHDLPSSPGKALVLGQVSRYRALAGDEAEAIRIGEQVLAMAEELELEELQAHALVTIGTAKANRGDAGGLENLERAVEIALASGASEIARAYNNLAVSAWALGDLRRGLRLMKEAIAHEERLGLGSFLRFSRNVYLWLLTRQEHWDEALPGIDEFLAACDAGTPHYHEGGMRLRRAVIRLARDDVEGALDDVRKVVPLAQNAADPQQRVPWLTGSARLFVEAGHVVEAQRLAPELSEVLRAGTMSRWALVELALVADELDCADELAAVVDGGPQTKWARATSALLRGDFVPSAEILHEIGDLELESTARLCAGECLAADGRAAEADEQLRRSLAFWRSVRATRYVRRCEALLSDVSEIPA